MNSKEIEKSEKQCFAPKAKLEAFGARHTMALMIFLGYTTITCMRVCINIAIVKMVLRPTEKNETSDIDNYLDYNSYNNTSFNDTDFESEGKEENNLIWNEATIGQVLGSFYYGYSAANMIGGVVADRWGAKPTFGISVILSSFMTVMTPFAAWTSPVILVVLRIAQGLMDGTGFPGTNSLVGVWFPSAERTKFTSFIHSGSMFGSVLCMSLTGWICSSKVLGGWPTAFYLFGTIGFIWSVLWFTVIHEEPSCHPSISDAELKHITSNCNTTEMKRFPLQWMKVLRSPYFYIVLFTNFGCKWCYYTILTELPTYFDSVLHFQIKNNGFVSSLPFMGAWFISVGFGYLMNFLSDRGTLSMINLRRTSMFVGSFIPGIGLIALAAAKYSPAISVTIFVVSISSYGAINSGIKCSYADIAPRFAGTLFGIATTVACTSGFLSPLLTSFLLEYYERWLAWKIVFLNAGLLFIISGSTYIFFMTTEVQHWNELENEEEENDQNECNDHKYAKVL